MVSARKRHRSSEMVKVKPSKDRERDKERDKDKSKDRERDSHKNRDSKDKEHKDKDKEHKANGKPAKELFKSPFSSDDLAKWRQLLLSRRAEISNDIDGLVKDAMEAEDGHTTPNHIAERGSDADLQDMSLGVAGEEK